MARVFISWSGETAKSVATALYEWLPFVIHELDPWVSAESIDVGSRWRAEIEKNLDTCSIGIFCLTPESLRSPWVNFEAGTLCARQGCTVFPYLIGMSYQEVITHPLGVLQSAVADPEGTANLLSSINKQLTNPLKVGVLEKQFQHYWAHLKSKIEEATKGKKTPDGGGTVPLVAQSDRVTEVVLELQREIIEMRREIHRSRINSPAWLSSGRRDVRGNPDVFGCKVCGRFFPDDLALTCSLNGHLDPASKGKLLAQIHCRWCGSAAVVRVRPSHAIWRAMAEMELSDPTADGLEGPEATPPDLDRE